jgi:fucose permease
MARRSEIVTVYAAGLIQGVALVTFPAASAVFTNSSDYGLSNTEYGSMFGPQVVLAIVSSLLGAALRRRLGSKLIYLTGLFANTFASAFFPKKADRAVLVLNALLGLGTALAPAFIAIFVGVGIWWGLPVLVGALLIGLILFSVGQTLGTGGSAHPEKKHQGKIPGQFWIFASFALLYGGCETMNGNWAVSYMTKHFGARASLASIALAIFWTTVTAGRILFAVIEKWFPERIVCRVLPFVVAAAFVATAGVPKTSAALGMLTFALAGLGCSALLPLTVSFGQKALTTMPASAAGGLIAFYQMGYGIAAFGVGPLQSRVGLDLKTIYGGTAVVALAMAAQSFVITRKQAPA